MKIEQTKTNIFITGATGHMGFEALKLFAENKSINLKLLVLPTKTERKKIKSYQNYTNIEIIEGDLRNIDDVRRGVEGSDYVFHIGALIPPVSDKNPKLTEEINLGGTINIIDAIREQQNPDSIKLIYIATVASMGNRPAPIHWGRVGDPIRVSLFDPYAISKVKAERAVIESGLKYWVSLRQSGMLHKDLLKIIDPIIFHQPLDNHIEWSTAEDSGQALYNIVAKDLPYSFWKNIYNLGSGEEFRETFYDFTKRLFAIIGVKDIHKIFKPRDFTTQNFHCVWYSDSDILNNWLDFRKSTYAEFLNTLEIPNIYRLIQFIHPWLIRKIIFEPLCRKPDGPRNWIENNVTEKIKAFWGSRENWYQIPKTWLEFTINRFPKTQLLDHGWDDTRQIETINLKDCKKAAIFRGGICFSEEMNPGDIFKSLQWQCSLGHQFKATANAVLRGGHWCPQCDTNVTTYEKQAVKNKFFAQVY